MQGGWKTLTHGEATPVTMKSRAKVLWEWIAAEWLSALDTWACKCTSSLPRFPLPASASWIPDASLHPRGQNQRAPLLFLALLWLLAWVNAAYATILGFQRPLLRHTLRTVWCELIVDGALRRTGGGWVSHREGCPVGEKEPWGASVPWLSHSSP